MKKYLKILLMSIMLFLTYSCITPDRVVVTHTDYRYNGSVYHRHHPTHHIHHNKHTVHRKHNNVRHNNHRKTR